MDESAQHSQSWALEKNGSFAKYSPVVSEHALLHYQISIVNILPIPSSKVNTFPGHFETFLGS